MKIVDKRKRSKSYLEIFLPGEVNALLQVSHPNIIGVLEIVETSHHCFFAMELAENGTLADYMNVKRRMAESEARHFFQQMCDAVAYCHSLQIVHRDLKMANIFLTSSMDVKIGGKHFYFTALVHWFACVPMGTCIQT